MNKVAIITEWPLRDGWERDFLRRRLLAEGIHESQIIWLSILSERPPQAQLFRAGPQAIADGEALLAASLRTEGPHTLLLLGDGPLKFITEKSGQDNWQSSVLESVSPHFSGRVVCAYAMERVAKDLGLQVWLSLACRKLSALLKGAYEQKPHVHLLNPPLEEALHFLRGPCASAERLSVDIETGRGQINTVGFAISGTEAIAINTLPDRLGEASYYELWSAIRDLLESEQPKILQNFLYEFQFFSRYGIALRNVTHDTMICQKFLWPEFEMGLHAVGRMYTDMPYWKQDNKSWNNIRDWEQHYEYNAKDTTGTYQGFVGQRADLEARGLATLHDDYLRRLYPCVAEMCSWGIPLSPDRLRGLQCEIDQKLNDVLAELKKEEGATELNPASNKQVKAFLAGAPRNYSIPKKYDSKTKKYKPSTDEKALKKLRMKYPEDQALTHLLGISKLAKAKSSYLSFTYDTDLRMRYSLTAGATETMRMAGYKDPWGHGVNPQTVPGGNKGINIKAVFEATPDHTFVQIDLKQAESRFVAYDAADFNLISALEDESRDVHSEVAMEILLALGGNVADKDDPKVWKKRWRQLGKKSGHGANYSMKEATFIESCIAEMDLVLSKTEATRVLEAYHTLFPGIRRWHASIRQELAQTRKLRNPLGFERHFYGRLDDDMFRQAYAFKPQSTIPMITNHLMLHLVESRSRGKFDFRLLLQCHDSLLLEVPLGHEGKISDAALLTEAWHPEIILPGGRLVIPTSIEVGRNWGEMKDV